MNRLAKFLQVRKDVWVDINTVFKFTIKCSEQNESFFVLFYILRPDNSIGYESSKEMGSLAEARYLVLQLMGFDEETIAKIKEDHEKL